MTLTLTYERAHDLFSLDKKTGWLYWKKQPSRFSHVKIGSRAGCLNKGNGYRQVKVDGLVYKEHRLIFMMVHGYFPEQGVDHINGIRNDNCPENLREVSQSCNMQNQAISSRNASGFPGVSFHKRSGKYRAHLVIRRKIHHLGLYTTALEAALARYTAEVWCPDWTCNHRSELVKAIKKAWPEFNPMEEMFG